MSENQENKPPAGASPPGEPTPGGEAVPEAVAESGAAPDAEAEAEDDRWEAPADPPPVYDPGPAPAYLPEAASPPEPAAVPRQLPPAPSQRMRSAPEAEPFAAPLPPREPAPKKQQLQPAKDGFRWRLWGPVAGLSVFLIIVVWFLSWRNSRYIYMECREDRVVAERGSKWPWGRGRIRGAAFKPVKLPPEADCKNRTYTDQAELEHDLTELLIDRAQAGLTSKKLEDVAEAKAQLVQALLLTRANTERRELIQRLQGDLAYREGGEQVGDSQKRIGDAIARFKEALERRPVHFHDAEAWIAHLEAAARALEEGPRPVDRIAEAANVPAPPPGTKPTPRPPGKDPDPATPNAEPGVEPAIAIQPDAGEPLAPPPKPDAGLPQGGVLL